MKIYSIIPYNVKNQYNKGNFKQQTYNTAPPPNSAQIPSTLQYLAFTGGYSMDLGQTIRQLDKLAQKNSSIYPPNIREWAGMIMEEGNKTKDTLISIHKKYFANLKNCFNLNEIKVKFPEFKEVISSGDIKASKGSFLDKFNRGELEFFDNDEDLSVQLIKLYWGEGFSLNDLKRYADGFDLYHTMKRLNIPTASRDYGHVLKFSDPEYNERLTREMTEKRLAALDRKAQVEEGEPVYIKRGPLSAEHKQKISEGLKKYYQENPEKIYDMSERQKEFYRLNPEKSEEISRVLNKAWNIFGADRIKAALSKFMKSKGVQTFNPENNPVDLPKEQSKLLKQFWGANEWARKSFSKNMEYAWKKVKEDMNKFYLIDITPEGFKKKFFQWAQEKNLNLNHLDFNFKIYKYKHGLDSGNGEEISKYTPKFIDEYSEKINIDQSRLMANSYLLSLINLSKDLKNISKKHNVSQETQKTIELSRHLIKELLFEQGNGLQRNIKSFDAAEIQDIYKSVLTLFFKLDNAEQFIQLFKKNLDSAYNSVDALQGKPVMLNREMLEGVLK
ncbi:MAG TPA: hypothetical protein IAD11_09800 [Candidatus Stercorousia faecigallinarum]|nr:hypothetical protein [Candidatus Stercorousia faecigallinarum]